MDPPGNPEVQESYKFNCIQDLIDVATKYRNSFRRPRKRTRASSIDLSLENHPAYNYDLETLYSCIGPLQKLNNLIGMEDVKKNIIDQVLFYIQGLNTDEMMHTCLTGPPGVGKTTLGKILAELYCSLGFLKTDNFRVVSRSDLIAGYLGQTALKTMKVLKESIGGVLFIDEAYSLGTNPGEAGDSYSKECIDTINKFLSEHTSNFILIIAGYREELERCFFTMNKGLSRRFPLTYHIEGYSADNIKELFIYQVKSGHWKLDIELIKDNFSLLKTLFTEYQFSVIDRIKLFENNGGDTLSLFDKAKIIHSRRVFGKCRLAKKYLNHHDIKSAFELLISEKKKSSKKVTEPPFGMYT